MNTTTRIDSPCPHCNVPLNTDISLREDTPRPGDVGICIECRDLHIFDDNLVRREITESNMEDMPLDEIAHYQKIIDNLKR